MPKNTRDKILDAGLRLISKKGYIGATTKEIAKKAGVAELTVFRHFSSKEKLFEEIVNKYTFLPALRGLLPELKDMDYHAALTLIAEKFLERLYERREMIRIMHSEVHRYPAKIKALYHSFIEETFKTLAAYFRDLQKKGVLRECDPELAARAFLGMFFSFFNTQEILMGKSVSEIDTEKVIEEYVGIFVRGTLK